MWRISLGRLGCLMDGRIGGVSMEKKKVNIILMIICMAIPLLVGIVSAAITGDAMLKFGELNQPPLSPPAWLFPVAWTILYLLMGLSSYFILVSSPDSDDKKKAKRVALITYVLQLCFNFAWCLLFFKLELYIIAFVWLIIMWCLIGCTMLKAFKVSFVAMIMLIPYIIWTTFAGYLNIMIAILN